MLLILRFFIPQSAFRIPKLKYLIVLISLMLCVGLPDGGLQAMPPVQRTVLPNQMFLLVSEEHSLPFVTFQLLINSGAWKDPSGEEGLSYLTARGLLLGTQNRTVNAINEELDFMGASLSSSSGRDYATLSLKVLKKDLDQGLDLLMDVLTQPVFPEEEIKREVEKTLAAI
jgi:zinc protease